MTKGYVDRFSEAIAGILLDAETLDPSLRQGFDRDLTRLDSLILKHGHSVLTLGFPSIGKALDAALDRGFLPNLMLPYSGRINTRTNIPRLFQGIWLKVFGIDGCLLSGIDPTWVRLLRQLYYVAAKEVLECAPSAVYQTTKEFFDVESRLPKPGPLWDSVIVDVHRDDCGSLLDLCIDDRVEPDLFESGDHERRALLTLCQQVADRVSASLGTFCPSTARYKQGRGATAEHARGRSYKYNFDHWSPQLESVFPYDQFGISSWSAGGDELTSDSASQNEWHSRLIDVPKTAKGPRLIAAEPGSNQWCQQAGLAFLARSIGKSNSRVVGSRAFRVHQPGIGNSIDFRNQYLSGELALEASRSLSHSTIDLKAASDRLSCWLVQRVFRGNLPLMNLLVSTRTRYMYNALDRKYPSHIKLRKFATMGSALTFPVQSITFFILAVSAVLYSRGLPSARWRNVCQDVRVYGDDLIVPIDGHERLVGLLQQVGLMVNPLKTFSGSNFRESCGTDAFRGSDVTPVKIRHLPAKPRPSDVISMVDTANLAFSKGLKNLSTAILSAVPRDLLLRIPVLHTSSGMWGVKVPWGPETPSLTRWNKDLQRTEAFLLQPKAVTRVSPRSESHANLLQFFTEDPVGSLVSEWTSGMYGVAESGFCRKWVAVSDLL